MPHECSDCHQSFDTLNKLSTNDCEVQTYTIQIKAKLVTNESKAYQEAKLKTKGLNPLQPVFPLFDMAVSGPLPPKNIQQKVGNELDTIYREEHGLWEWAENISKDQVRETPPVGKGETNYYDVGSIEIQSDGEIIDTFVTLEEIKSAVKRK